MYKMHEYVHIWMGGDRGGDRGVYLSSWEDIL